MNIPDHISESLETIFWAKNIKILWCGPDTQHAEYKLEKANKSKKRARCYGAQQQISTDVREVGIGDRGDRKQM